MMNFGVSHPLAASSFLAVKICYNQTDIREPRQHNSNKYKSCNVNTEIWGKSTRSINRNGEPLMVPECTFYYLLPYLFLF